MDSVAFYQKLYSLFDEANPLAFDCGKLCNSACCSPELPGMYLFPGEEALFAGKPGFTLTDAELPGWGNVKLLSCSGRCNRGLRPLSCRIFPLAPKVEGDAVRVRPDPRGKAVCPLCNQPLSALCGGFMKAAQEAFTALLAEPETADFLRALSNIVDEYANPLF
jgi:hypothetical protein